ncbi:MAG: SpoIVB peptidase [Clostridia bacterium]|nr:SpoIVB peptidase [Clostridia bacterium]MBO5432994.1 SpoIVB peptidase [Clostridia bacterium]
MKKSKVILSFLSFVLTSLLLVFVLSSENFIGEETVNISINGVSRSIQNFGNNILSFFDNNKENNVNPRVTNTNELVYIGGYPIGLKLYADGVVIVGTEAVDTENGNVNTAEKAGLKIGDVIKRINGKTVKMNTEVSQAVENSNGEVLTFTVERNGETFAISFETAYSVSEGKYKAGLWIRDSSAGIGTVTFATQDGYFASLGHAVCDIDTKTCIPISSGECTIANITGFIKGVQGSAGELCGYLENETIGKVYSNCDIGVYGEFDSIPQGQLYPIANENEITQGKATVITTCSSGDTAEYEIEIESVNLSAGDNKHLVLKVTDSNLIGKTGGIVQGMSGSPIIQNGKIIGAVTHVFLNDATGGYGITAQTMLQNLNEIKLENEALDNAS